MNRFRKTGSFPVLIGVMTLSAACNKVNDFLDVKNPNNLEAEAIDAERDRTLLSQSAYQSFVAQYGNAAVYSAWFTNEARVGDTFPTRNDFGKRDVATTGDQSGFWNAWQTAMQFARSTIVRVEAAGNNVDLARLYFTSGYSILMLGEMFCQGTIAGPDLEPRGPMTEVQMMDSAIAALQKAHDIAAGITGSAEATSIANASLVGIARAHMDAGRKSQASSVAGQVPANFTYNLLHLDDPSNRNRLGNTIWSFSEARISLVVGPEFRAMADAGDTRIGYTDMKRVAQDGQLNFFRQAKITGWGSSDRLASSLEAQYIKVEADADATAMLTFINARRAVGKQTAMAPTTDMTELLKAADGAEDTRFLAREQAHWRPAPPRR